MRELLRSGYIQVDGDKLPDPARLPPPAGLKKHMTQSERIAKFIADTGSKNLPPEAAGCLKSAEPAISGAIKLFIVVAPIYKKFYLKAYEIYKVLPKNVIQMIFGIALCFFGGTYVGAPRASCNGCAVCISAATCRHFEVGRGGSPQLPAACSPTPDTSLVPWCPAASIAAIEAFRQLGWQTVYTNLEILYAQTQLVIAASEEDDKVDDDGDGIADVDQIEAADLAQRKLQVAMKAIKEPDRLQVACGALFSSYLAVLATLRLEFARTTAFALGIVEMAKYPIIRTLAPLVRAAPPPSTPQPPRHSRRFRARRRRTPPRHSRRFRARCRQAPPRTLLPHIHMSDPSVCTPHAAYHGLTPSCPLSFAQVAASIGSELAHWTQTIVETTLTFFAIIFAWFLQMIISAFYSGLRGGKLFADGLIKYTPLSLLPVATWHLLSYRPWPRGMLSRAARGRVACSSAYRPCLAAPVHRPRCYTWHQSRTPPPTCLWCYVSGTWRRRTSWTRSRSSLSHSTLMSHSLTKRSVTASRPSASPSSSSTASRCPSRSTSSSSLSRSSSGSCASRSRWAGYTEALYPPRRRHDSVVRRLEVTTAGRTPCRSCNGRDGWHGYARRAAARRRSYICDVPTIRMRALPRGSARVCMMCALCCRVCGGLSVERGKEPTRVLSVSVRTTGQLAACTLHEQALCRSLAVCAHFAAARIGHTRACDMTVTGAGHMSCGQERHVSCCASVFNCRTLNGQVSKYTQHHKQYPVNRRSYSAHRSVSRAPRTTTSAHRIGIY